jgi:HSP20 family protein
MALSEFPHLSFDPFTELRRMQSEMNRLFGGFTAATARDFPPINIWLAENSVVVTAELAGVTAGDVNLNLQEDVLTLGGKRDPKTRQQNVNWQRRERAYGAFSRAVQLPFRVNPPRQDRDVMGRRHGQQVPGRVAVNRLANGCSYPTSAELKTLSDKRRHMSDSTSIAESRNWRCNGSPRLRRWLPSNGWCFLWSLASCAAPP